MERDDIIEYLQSLKEEMRNEKKKVKDALEKIATNNQDLMKEIGKRLKDVNPNNHHNKGKEKKHKDDKKKHFVRFLLWDGTFPEKSQYNLNKMNENGKLEVQSTGSTLNIESNEEISGIAYIYDSQGTQIAELGSVNLSEGENTIALGSISSDLNNGAFFIIKGEKATQRGKFIYLK